MSGVKTQTAETVQERLIEAAGEIFAEKGFRSATVREITSLAGANVAAVNYYFRDKQELYGAALRRAMQGSVSMEQAIDESMPYEEQLHEFIVGRFLHLLDPRRPHWHAGILAREMSSPTESLDMLVDEFIRPRLSLFRRIITGLAGPLPEKQLTLVLLSVIGQCAFYRQSAGLIDRLFPKLMHSPQSIPEIAQHVTQFSLAGIRSCGTTSA